ncbi:hypothetical protein [Candidatus Palauibacter sp.]|uniref:hypothetical protein n=1 Tax=Candidatus Palauibacter sp. TaxID=3101350 RepID=UPI003B5C4F89
MSAPNAPDAFGMCKRCRRTIDPERAEKSGGSCFQCSPEAATPFESVYWTERKHDEAAEARFWALMHEDAVGGGCGPTLVAHCERKRADYAGRAEKCADYAGRMA